MSWRPHRTGNHCEGASRSNDRMRLPCGGSPRRPPGRLRMISDRLEKLVEEMVDRGVQFDDAVRELEKRFIARVVASCDGSVTKAAERLGIHRNTLTRKMDAYKIRRRSG